MKLTSANGSARPQRFCTIITRRKPSGQGLPLRRRHADDVMRPRLFHVLRAACGCAVAGATLEKHVRHPGHCQQGKNEPEPLPFPGQGTDQAEDDRQAAHEAEPIHALHVAPLGAQERRHVSQHGERRQRAAGPGQTGPVGPRSPGRFPPALDCRLAPSMESQGPGRQLQTERAARRLELTGQLRGRLFVGQELDAAAQGIVRDEVEHLAGMRQRLQIGGSATPGPPPTAGPPTHHRERRSPSPTSRPAASSRLIPTAARPSAPGAPRARRGRSRSRCRLRAPPPGRPASAGWTAVGQPANAWIASSRRGRARAQQAARDGEQRALDQELRGHVAAARPARGACRPRASARPRSPA